MGDETKINAKDKVGLVYDEVGTEGYEGAMGLIPTPIDPAQHLQFRKDHLEELENRVKRTDYSPGKMAKYREALARARSEVAALENGS